MTRPPLLTQYSEHAHIIADTVRAAFAASRLGDSAIEMTAPTESTQGGKRPLQHVTLKGPSGHALVVGTVNARDGVAHLKSYRAVAELHAERFQRPVGFDEAAYRSFIETTTSILGGFGIAATVKDDPPDPQYSTRTSAAAAIALRTQKVKRIADPTPASIAVKIMLTLVVAVIAGSVVFWLIARAH